MDKVGLRATRAAVERHDSFGFVVARVRRNNTPTPNRCTVNVSSISSSRLGAALGLITSSCRTVFSVFRQMLSHISPLMDLAALHFRPIARNETSENKIPSTLHWVRRNPLVRLASANPALPFAGNGEHHEWEIRYSPDSS
jgi:hypothetical protein